MSTSSDSQPSYFTLQESAEVFAIGIGECGSNLVGSYFQEVQKGILTSRFRQYLILNTDRTDIQKAQQIYNIPSRNTLEIGEGVGVGGKFADGYNAVMESKDLILSRLRDLGFEGVNGFIITTALGGGTGCGGTPALIRILRERFAQEERRRIFIYVIGVLPFANQSNEALNSIWALSTLLRQQQEDMGPDLILLFSNRTMLNRILSWQRGGSHSIINKELGIDESDLTQMIEGKKTPDIGPANEGFFARLVNPLALHSIELMLSPGIPESGKSVHPTTDLGDFARKLDPVVVPAFYEDVAIFPEVGDLDKQLALNIDYTAAKCTLTELGSKPSAKSVFAILSGSQKIARVEYDPLLKNALKPFIARGASITPSYVAYEDENRSASIMLLFGVPQIPEMRHLLEEARELIKLHSGPSELDKHWFIRNKGVTREEVVKAVHDIEQYFLGQKTPL